ncbi:hypothetical protein EIP86_008171 [Pleurotus ostreatoroseus]|nr:hypothetical protein EIP86_008171 [Pleurotus ostreatoroseus]
MSDEAVTTSLQVQAVINKVQAATRRPKLVLDNIPRKVFIVGTCEEHMYAYVGLNTQSIPDKKPEPQPRTVLRHFDIYDICYLYDQFHWMAFLPQTLEFDGPILRCLKHTRSDVPYETIRKNGHGTLYVLPEWMVKNLDGLWEVITALHRSLTRIRHIVFPLDTRTAPSPKSCGYDRLFSTTKDLKDTWIQTRAFFTFHLCYVSYLVCLCTSLEDIKADRPSWLAQLEELSLIDTSIYDDLKGTWVFDLKIPRLGGFIEADKGASSDSDGVHSTVWIQYIPWIARRAPGVPFWLLYKACKGFPEGDDRFEVVKELQPTAEELSTGLRENLREKEAANAQNDGWANGIYEEQEGTNPEQHLMSTFSRIAGYTAAQTSDPWGYPMPGWGDQGFSQNIRPMGLSPPPMKQLALPHYLEQLKSWQQRMEAAETPYQRGKRIEREVAQQDQPVPRGGKPTVYLWENGLDDSWTWEVVGKRRVQEVWTDSTPYQRIYDPFSNAYHVSYWLPSYPEGAKVRPSITCYDDDDEDDEDFMDIDNEPPQPFGVSVLETKHRWLTKEASQNRRLTAVIAPARQRSGAVTALVRPRDEVVTAPVRPRNEVVTAPARPRDEVVPVLARPRDQVVTALARPRIEVIPAPARPRDKVVPAPAPPCDEIALAL